MQRFQFQKVSTNGIANRLKYILDQENITPMNFDGIDYIAKLSNGGMRLAIQYMEKCLAYSCDLKVADVVKALNVTDYNDFIGLTNLLLDPSDRASLVTRLDEIYASGVDFKQFLKQNVSFILDINKALILDDLDDAFKYINLPRTSEIETWLTTVLEHGDLEFFNKLLSHLVKLDADVKYSQNPKVDIECGFLLFEVK